MFSSTALLQVIPEKCQSMNPIIKADSVLLDHMFALFKRRTTRFDHMCFDAVSWKWLHLKFTQSVWNQESN